MGWLSFTSLPFLVAGAIFATGPVIIHLLNRRRYRVVPWAAMDFLREALKKNRKILQLRDLVLLVLRTLAVLLFGAALARPYLTSRDQQVDGRQPLHAILVIDNSLSMAYESLEGSLLDKAKQRARELVDGLPAGSQITVLSACGSREAPNFDPLALAEETKEALAKIEIVDRSAKIAQVANLARRACEEAPQLAKRILFFTDQQELNWRDARAEELFRGLPPMQVVSVAPAAPENTWIADLRLQDGLADLETPTTVVIALSHRGISQRRDVQVTLSVGDTVVGQQAVTIEPGFGTREVSFECTFSGLAELPEPGQAVFVPLQATITADRLPADDQRYLAAPIVAALPVIFVDQYGPDEEDAARGRLGETRHLRKLLAPRTSRSDAPRQLISVRHVSPDGLTRELLSDARLVVVAGVRQPGNMAALLADYVHQGGQLVLAAGVDFDPAAWNAAGWLDGKGILPLPLLPDPIGNTPEEALDKLEPFSLAFDSLTDESIFRLAGVAEADLKSLYAEPFFFKAVQVDESPAAVERLKHGDGQQAGDIGDRGTDKSGDPQVLARFETRSQAIFLVSRQIGRGNALFCSTGLLSSWNTLPKTNAIFIFDRLLRGMIQNTLPERNMPPADQITLPLPRLNQNLAITMSRPGRVTEDPLEVTYIGAQQRGVTLNGLLGRGIYYVRGRKASSTPDMATQKPVWELPLAINGTSDESNLTVLTPREFEQATAGAEIRFVAAGEAINLAGAATSWQNSWWWLTLGVLALLVGEMLVLIKP